ncbi:MAG: endo-1,4-beta-xylanase [Treponema sp.]|nr:endo-1,4-beta-xylanase [Candidatus Treponema scatequi]
MKKLSIVSIFLMAVLCFSSCGKSFRDGAKEKGFNSGIALAAGSFLDPNVAKIVKENSYIVVSENSMKWQNLRPNKTFWNWNDVDQLIKFADENGMIVKWHTLFWHQQNSNFISSNWTREEALAAMDEHIETIMTRYKGKIKEYDVVNEMFEEDGSFRQNVWYKTIGPDYIEHALIKAREVDPDAKLYLNEYNNEEKGNRKADAMFNFVKDLKDRGVPIDGVGMQLHLDTSYNYSEEAVRRNIQRYAEIGIDISFSEVDIRVPMDSVEAHQALQTERYLSLYKLAAENSNVKSVITWGWTDKGSWIPATFPGKGSALMYDAQGKPKPVYNEVKKFLCK